LQLLPAAALHGEGAEVMNVDARPLLLLQAHLDSTYSRREPVLSRKKVSDKA
jgi:hypothetical protein